MGIVPSPPHQSWGFQAQAAISDFLTVVAVLWWLMVTSTFFMDVFRWERDGGRKGRPESERVVRKENRGRPLPPLAPGTSFSLFPTFSGYACHDGLPSQNAITICGHFVLAPFAITRSASHVSFHFIRNIKSPQESSAPVMPSDSSGLSKPCAVSLLPAPFSSI